MRRHLVPLLLVAACGGDDDFEYEGTAGVITPADFSGDIPAVVADVSGSGPRVFFADTGAPFTILDTTTFPQFPDGKHDIDLGVFSLTFRDYPALSWDVFGDGAEVAGLIGGDLLRHFAVSLDYRGQRIWVTDPFDREVAPDDISVEAEASVPFELEGGGLGLAPGNCGALPCTIDVPATRIMVRASIEGHEPVWLLVDSGASAVVLDDDYLAVLGEAGRPRLDGVPIETVDGVVPGALTRIWRLDLLDDDEAVAGADSVVVLVIPGSGLVDSLERETGIEVAGFVGGSFLRSHLSTFDYPDRRLRLARYTDQSHVPPDEFIGPGFTLRADGFVWRIDLVFPRTDAEAQGLQPGQVVEAIGGVEIAGQPSMVVFDLLTMYPVGYTVPVKIQDPRPDQPFSRTHQILVEDLLPAYPQP